jgi:signal transduction histidine kinase
LAQLSTDNPVVMIENRVISGSGKSHWMQFSNRGFFNTDGKLREIQSVGRDITQRKQAETALREMAADNESRMETERKRIAREVHDELGQLLTALRMDILYLQMRYCTLDAGLGEKTDSMKRLVDQAMQGVRNVAAHLRPVALDMGLTEAVRWLCTEFSNKTGVPCHLQSTLAAPPPDEQKSTVLFRIVQESLTNITRYAHPTQVRVHMECLDQTLKVSVVDNGVGFDLQQPSIEKSFGLLGMQERALALGGKVTICSSPGAGTSVTVSIPLDAADTKVAA